jgi:hypothetical protein
MRFPNQAPPIFRAFMREVIGKRWASEPEPDPAGLAPPARAKKRGRRKQAAKPCLVELTTFAASRSRGALNRAA